MFCSQILMHYINYYFKLSLHCFLGLPLGLLPVTSPSYTCFTNPLPFISSILTFHLLYYFFTISITVSCPRDLSTYSFLILSSLVTPSTLLRNIISHACILLLWRRWYISHIHHFARGTQKYTPPTLRNDRFSLLLLDEALPESPRL